MSTTLLLSQLAAILIVAHACGWLLTRIGQPKVLGEMAAGIVLGPLCLGRLFPALHSQLFSKASLGGLSALSTIGLVLFMFLIGLELRAPEGTRAQIKAAGWVGSLSVAMPFALGLAIAPTLYSQSSQPGTRFWPFALFIATALSITALPVMARILKDRGMANTRVGRLSLSAAAIVDVFAWVLLAFAVAAAGVGDAAAGLRRTGVGALLFVAIACLGLRPALSRLVRWRAPGGEPTATAFAALMIGLVACAAISEWLRLHAIFGAFLFGCCLPRDDGLLRSLAARIEPLCLVVLLPVFFATAGLDTTPDAFAAVGAEALGLILAAAVIGKVAGGAAGARIAGYGWQESLATGSLMNARGLMELIVLKVGLEAGLIGPAMFTMLLMMALATTAMTGPLVALCSAGRRSRTREPDADRHAADRIGRWQ